SCQITYADDSLRFCLQDGTGLLDYADNMPAPTVDFSERETVVRQKPVTSGWQPIRVTQDARVEPEAKKSNTIPAVIITALVACVFFGGAIMIWRMLGGSASENANGRNKTSTPTITPAIDRTPVTPYVNERWQPIDYNASLNGERLTYYRGTTPEQCKADCDENPKCKGFTLIRAGSYYPNDPPMCYLLSEVTSSAPASCCISAIKK
ncbi:MAG TPA: PAN domain-containing protein, partial [Pyrinomonadaceae bacterium]